MRKISVGLAVLFVFALTFQSMGAGEQTFKDLVGPVTVGNVTATNPLVVPYITWGGDVATFHANGGLTTTKDSIYGKLGLNLKLVAGDDYLQQNRDYVSGRSAFLRPTMHMAGLSSELIASDPRTKGVVVLQLTWSVGDHFVVRGDRVRSLSELRGKKIVLQRAGPHIGFLDDILATAGLRWEDITVVWAPDLTATDNSPAAIFRRDAMVDGAFVISPDMLGLTGGLRDTGTGAEGTVKGSRVLVSTAELSRSIADVYVVRKDFYDANKALVTKFVAGYLKAVEEIVAWKKQYEVSGSEQYMGVLRLAQSIYGESVLPTLEVDAHGLISDCVFAGYPGNVAFFTEPKNLNGFEAIQNAALNLATSRGFAKVRTGLFPSGLAYDSPAFVGYLANTTVERTERFRAEAVEHEIESLGAGALDERTLYAFSINFEANQSEFSATVYGAEFQRVVELASKFANAVIAVRGHADPTKSLFELVKAGVAKGILKQSGTPGNYQYFYEGRQLDLTQTADIVRLIESGAFDGVTDHNPRETMQAALNLSRVRAESVRDSIVQYATNAGLHLDRSQIQPVGVGIREPLVAKPRNTAEAAQNMRVEFRLVRVDAEAMSESDFGF